MWKTLNLKLFKPWFIFSFKWNKHLVVKDYQTEVLVINLEWDSNLELFLKKDTWIYDPIQFFHDIDDIFYKLSYIDILEDILHSDLLRWEKVDTTLLIEEEYDNTDTSYS